MPHPEIDRPEFPPCQCLDCLHARICPPAEVPMCRCRDCRYSRQLDTLPFCGVGLNAFEIDPDRDRRCYDFEPRDKQDDTKRSR